MSANLKVQQKRVIKAKRKDVYEAWITPEVLKDFIAPGALEVPKVEINLKVGGSYRIEMRGDLRGSFFEGAVAGRYEKIVPNELLSFTWEWQDPNMMQRTGQTLLTIEFRDVPGGTELTLTHERFATPEGRDGHDRGWADSLDKLTRRLAL